MYPSLQPATLRIPGVVLLAGTMPMWFQFDWARALLATTGALTIIQAGTTAQVRAGRNGPRPDQRA